MDPERSILEEVIGDLQLMAGELVKMRKRLDLLILPSRARRGPAGEDEARGKAAG